MEPRSLVVYPRLNFSCEIFAAIARKTACACRSWKEIDDMSEKETELFVLGLAAFVCARLDEDEADALAATPGPWVYNPGKAWFPDPSIIDSLRAGRAEGAAGSLASYAVLGSDEYDRARYGEEFVKAGSDTCVATTGPTDDPQSMADARHIVRQDPASTLARVAALRALVTRDELYCRYIGHIWSRHPDYRQEWAPREEQDY